MKDDDHEEIIDTPDESSSSEEKEIFAPPKKRGIAHASRNDLQWGRRFFHMATGTLTATIYALFLEHKIVVYSLGAIASLIYLFEQIRLSYPEQAEKLKFINVFLLRAEEQLKESAAMPYAIALLLTIITFPKIVALIAIYTLAFGDPLSAIIGIKWGKHKIYEGKSWEGLGAYFLACFCVSFGVLSFYFPKHEFDSFMAALVIAILSSLTEIIPLKIDDNLTIPLFTGIIVWPVLMLWGFFPL